MTTHLLSSRPPACSPALFSAQLPGRTGPPAWCSMSVVNPSALQHGAKCTAFEVLTMIFRVQQTYTTRRIFIAPGKRGATEWVKREATRGGTENRLRGCRHARPSLYTRELAIPGPTRHQAGTTGVPFHLDLSRPARSVAPPLNVACLGLTCISFPERECSGALVHVVACRTRSDLSCINFVTQKGVLDDRETSSE